MTYSGRDRFNRAAFWAGRHWKPLAAGVATAVVLTAGVAAAASHGGGGSLSADQAKAALQSAGLCESGGDVLSNGASIAILMDGPSSATSAVSCMSGNESGGQDSIDVYVFGNSIDTGQAENALAGSGVEVVGDNWVAVVQSILLGSPGATAQKLQSALGGSVLSN